MIGVLIFIPHSQCNLLPASYTCPLALRNIVVILMGFVITIRALIIIFWFRQITRVMGLNEVVDDHKCRNQLCLCLEVISLSSKQDLEMPLEKPRNALYMVSK